MDLTLQDTLRGREVQMDRPAFALLCSFICSFCLVLPCFAVSVRLLMVFLFTLYACSIFRFFHFPSASVPFLILSRVGPYCAHDRIPGRSVHLRQPFYQFHVDVDIPDGCSSEY